MEIGGSGELSSNQDTNSNMVLFFSTPKLHYTTGGCPYSVQDIQYLSHSLESKTA